MSTHFIPPLDMDRVSPSQRPESPVAGYHTWLDLTFIHWRVPLKEIVPLIPAELTLDTWDGDAWVGVVPFHMRGIRPWWSPALPWLCAFPETNLRTYVHFRGGAPGVWFFSLDASRWLAVMAARKGWHLPYFWARKSIAVDQNRFQYRSRRFSKRQPAETLIEIEVGEWFSESGAVPGTLEHFLIERYLLYAQTPRGRILQGQVHHRPYPLREARLIRCEETLSTASGIQFAGAPCHTLFSPGVSVEVFGLRPVT